MNLPEPTSTYPDADTLARRLAVRIAAQLSERLAIDGQAALAVSGGRTPSAMLRALGEQPLRWERVTVTLVDERWVDEDSPRSNAAMVRATLLQGKAASARFVPLHRPGLDIDAGRAQADEAIAALPRPFAAVTLGMGDDGHTASFFPGGDRLADALSLQSSRNVEAIRAPGAGEPRLTLTLPRLLSTDLLVLHIEGAAKQAVLAQAGAAGPVDAMPVRAVLRQARVPVEIHWCP